MRTEINTGRCVLTLQLMLKIESATVRVMKLSAVSSLSVPFNA